MTSSQFYYVMMMMSMNVGQFRIFFSSIQKKKKKE